MLYDQLFLGGGARPVDQDRNRNGEQADDGQKDDGQKDDGQKDDGQKDGGQKDGGQDRIPGSGLSLSPD
jgi:hypothetical protein